ncbi:hypothetical protein PGT21_007204 [Puccinia graminis f. sp. tritici]|uniref:Ubiquitin-like protein ATG12 n=1 Tax=Puccinia graminis f. sp. tritici TaxID=56615 RepID=A0A5B0Q9W2_PUCGR|nr:hypothetical protein PGT21_007204 [Puccinia graminis f. sp. tritici]
MSSTHFPTTGLAEATKALEEFKQRDASKVVVRFKATGSAPIMKQNFFKITSSNRFQAVIAFLRKELGLKPTDPVVRIHSLRLHNQLRDSQEGRK